MEGVEALSSRTLHLVPVHDPTFQATYLDLIYIKNHQIPPMNKNLTHRPNWSTSYWKSGLFEDIIFFHKLAQ